MVGWQQGRDGGRGAKNEKEGGVVREEGGSVGHWLIAEQWRYWRAGGAKHQDTGIRTTGRS